MRGIKPAIFNEEIASWFGSLNEFHTMKNYLFVLIAFLLFGANVSAQEVLQLNLQETISYALENNVDAKNAKLELMIAEATVKEETSKGLPQINGSFNLNYNPSIPVVFLPNQPPFGDPSIDSVVL